MQRIRVFEHEANVEELKTMLSNGETLEAIGQRFDVSSSRIKDEIRWRDLAYLRPAHRRQVHPLSANRGWSPERVDMLKKLWDEGLSCSRIAYRLGDTTRNAVIGKVARLGLQPRGTKYRKSDGLIPKASRVGIRTAPKPPVKQGQRLPWGTVVTNSPRSEHDKQAARDLVARLALPQETDIARVTFLELEDHHCRFPIGDPKEKSFGFCGDEKVPGLPYCCAHAIRAFEGPKLELVRREMERRETSDNQVEREREDA